MTNVSTSKKTRLHFKKYAFFDNVYLFTFSGEEEGEEDEEGAGVEEEAQEGEEGEEEQEQVQRRQVQLRQLRP